MMGKSKKRKPAGYWKDIENIKKEILPLCEQFERMPTFRELLANGIYLNKMYDVVGGMSGLAKMLGYEKIPITKEEKERRKRLVTQKWRERSKNRTKEYNKQYRLNNLEYEKNRNKEYVKNNLEKIIKKNRGKNSSRDGVRDYLFHTAKTASKKKNLNFNIDKPWLEAQLQKGECAVSGIPFIYDVLDDHAPFRPSLDRINPIAENVFKNKTVTRDNGYTKSNCQLVCFAYNALKGYESHHEAMMIARALVNPPKGEGCLEYDMVKDHIEVSTIFIVDEELTPVQRYKLTIKGRATSLFNGSKHSVKTHRKRKRRTFEFSISKKWVLEKLEKGVCEVTNLPFNIRGNARSLFLPSIDRINSKIGYTKENCHMVLFGYNNAKNMNTHEDVMRLAKALVKRYPTPTNRIRVVDVKGNPIGDN
jgi:hypothetical protein